MEYDSNGKVVDFNVPDGDPRLSATVLEDGTRKKPTAKVHIDYTGLVSSHRLDNIVWTAKGAGRGVAKQINLACASSIVIDGKEFPKPPMYARAFVFRSQPGQNDSQAIGVGIPRLVTRAEFAAGQQLAASLKAASDAEADRF